MFSEQLAAAMPNIISQLSASINQNLGGPGNGTGSGTGGLGTGGAGAGGSAAILTDDDRRGCSYKTFMGCKPLEFEGTEGAVGIRKWIEKTESVLKISGCAENKKVLYATCTFQGKALTWWNTEVRTRGGADTDAMTWGQLKEILLAEYCPRNEIQKIEIEFWELTMKGADIQGYTNRFYELSQLVPHMVTPEHKGIDRYIWGLIPQIRSNVIASRPTTMQSAISIANIMTDDMVRIGRLTVKEAEKKRKRFDNRGGAERKTDEEDQQRIQNLAAVIPERKQYVGPHPLCGRCNYHHVGACTYCSKCKKKGHTDNACRMGLMNQGLCFECGNPGHIKKDCPRLNQNAKKAANPPRGRVFVLGAQEANQDTEE